MALTVEVRVAAGAEMGLRGCGVWGGAFFDGGEGFERLEVIDLRR